MKRDLPENEDVLLLDAKRSRAEVNEKVIEELDASGNANQEKKTVKKQLKIRGSTVKDTHL